MNQTTKYLTLSVKVLAAANCVKQTTLQTPKGRMRDTLKALILPGVQFLKCVKTKTFSYALILATTIVWKR